MWPRAAQYTLAGRMRTAGWRPMIQTLVGLCGMKISHFPHILLLLLLACRDTLASFIVLHKIMSHPSELFGSHLF